MVVRMAAIGQASSPPAIRRIELPRWLHHYTSAIACTRNGGSGPSGNGTIQVTLAPADVLVCTLTNERK